MSTPVFHRRRAERFAQLLDETDGGRHHQAPASGDDELAGLVAVSQRLSATHLTVDIDPDFRADVRALLIATAERDGIGATAKAGTPGVTTPARTPRRPPRPAFAGRRARTRSAIIAGVAIGAITVSGISAASDNSVPGDALYGMKRSAERAQLALAGSDTSRGQLHLDFARTRLAEAQALRDDAISLTTVLGDMDADTRTGISLLTASAMHRKDDAALQELANFVAGQRHQLTALLQKTDGVERDRVTASLTVLDAVTRRLELLRAALACGAGPADRTDVLGPLPGTCTN